MSSTPPNAEGPQGVALLELAGVRAVQLYEGEQDDLASGDLQVLIVQVNTADPTLSPRMSAKRTEPDPTTDVWLVLSIGSAFALPVKSSQVVSPERATSSYLFPSSDVPGASIRLFVPAGEPSISAFEDTLAQYCAFQSDDRSDAGQIELVDEHGAVLGTLDGGYTFREDPTLRQRGHEKDPVLVDLEELEPTGMEGISPAAEKEAKQAKEVGVRPLPGADSDDWLIKGASFISRGLIQGSTYLGAKMNSAADAYIEKSRSSSPVGGYIDDGKRGSMSDSASMMSTATTGAGKRPLTFSKNAHKAAGQAHKWTGKAVKLSHSTTTAVLTAASGVGASIGQKTGIQGKPRADGTPGPPPKGIRGVINRGLIAANIVLEGVDQSAERLLTDGGNSAGKAIEHRFGSEAKVVSGQVGSIGKGIFMVYKDVSGVRRKCLLHVAKGTMVRARTDDGREVILQLDADGSKSPGAGASASASGSGAASPAYPGNPYAAQAPPQREFSEKSASAFTQGPPR